MGFEPTTLRDLVGCSNHLSYWRLYGEQGPICGFRLEPHHAAFFFFFFFFPSPPQINIMLLLFHL